MLALCSYTATYTTGDLDVAMAPTYKRVAPYIPTPLKMIATDDCNVEQQLPLCGTALSSYTGHLHTITR